MGQDTSKDIAYQVISDILSQQDILLSVNSATGILLSSSTVSRIYYDKPWETIAKDIRSERSL